MVKKIIKAAKDSTVVWDAILDGYLPRGGSFLVQEPNQVVDIELEQDVKNSSYDFTIDFVGKEVEGKYSWAFVDSDTSTTPIFYTNQIESYVLDGMIMQQGEFVSGTVYAHVDPYMAQQCYIPLYMDKECTEPYTSYDLNNYFMNNMGASLYLFATDANGEKVMPNWGIELSPPSTDMSTEYPIVPDTYASLVNETVTIEWGDGQQTQITDGVFTTEKLTHTYVENGIKHVKISSTNGQMPQLVTEHWKQKMPKQCTSVDSPLLWMVDAKGKLSTNFSGLYSDAKFTTVPENLFWNNPQASDFNNVFMDTNINTIPSTLLKKCPKVTNISGMFRRTQLASIDAKFFDTCTNVTTISNLFEGTKLKTLPVGIFDKMTKVTNIEGLFSDCSIEVLPTGIFDKMTKITNAKYVCSHCSSLTSLPDGLFANNLTLTTVERGFQYCSNITTIPSDIFANNKSITSFHGVFTYCSKMNIPSTAFGTDLSTRFVGCGKVNLIDAFGRTEYTGEAGKAGTAPALWTATFDEEPYMNWCFGGNGNKTLSNYNEIPSKWGGPEEAA